MMKKWRLLKYIPISRLECKNHTLFMTKMAEISLNWTEKPYPLGPHIPIYWAVAWRTASANEWKTNLTTGAHCALLAKLTVVQVRLKDSLLTSLKVFNNTFVFFPGTLCSLLHLLSNDRYYRTAKQFNCFFFNSSQRISGYTINAFTFPVTVRGNSSVNLM